MKFIFKEKINSTNTFGKENIDGLEDKSVVYSAFQTQGRGRMERKWLSFNSENLYASIILKPQGDFSKLPVSNLTQLLSVVIVDVLKTYGITSYIKWPNDIVLNIKDDGISGEKICGILAEAATSANKIKGIVLGFGLNVNATEEELSQIDRPATSMFNHTGKNYSVKEVLEEITKEFFDKYDEFMLKGFSLIKDDYLSKTKFINKEVVLNMPTETLTGTVHSVNNEGALILNDKQDLRTITIGEIQC